MTHIYYKECVLSLLEIPHYLCISYKSSITRQQQPLERYSLLLAVAVGIMTRRLGAELEPEMTAVLNRPAAPGSLPRAPSPSILRQLIWPAMLCRWRRPAAHTLQPARRGHEATLSFPSPTPRVTPNVIADSGSSLVEDSTPSTLMRGVTGLRLDLRSDGVSVSKGRLALCPALMTFSRVLFREVIERETENIYQ